MDSGFLEFLWECVGVVVWGIWSFGEAEGASDDDGGVGGYEKIGAEVCVASADDDWFEVAAQSPVDGVCDLVECVGKHEDRVLAFAFEHGQDGFEALVGLVVGLRIGKCLVEDGVEGFGVVVVEGDDEAGVADEGEVFGGPAVGAEDGGASGDGAAGGEDADGEDAVGSCDGDDDGVGVDGDIGADFRGHGSDFVVVAGGADEGDFFETEACDRVDESRVDVHAGEVDDFGVCGEGDAGHNVVGFADDADLSIVHGDDGVFDCAIGDGVGGCADEEDGVVLFRGGWGEVLGGGGRDEECCDECWDVFHGWSFVCYCARSRGEMGWKPIPPRAGRKS